jgi:hypothetical protein
MSSNPPILFSCFSGALLFETNFQTARVQEKHLALGSAFQHINRIFAIHIFKYILQKSTGQREIIQIILLVN